jgi:YVTN family beta-propeller protein
VETVVARRRHGAILVVVIAGVISALSGQAAAVAGSASGLGAFANRGGSVYAGTAAGMLSDAVAGDPERVYVPDSGSGTVEVIDPATFQVVDRLVVGPIPHHVTPSWDLTRLYVDNEGFNSLTVIDPRTAKPVGSVPATHPYNLYFTPDGTKAVDVVERFRRIDFLDPRSWALIRSVNVPWPGVDHLDFSTDGSHLLASTEYGGMLVEIDTRSMAVSRSVKVGGYPIDVRLAPDGSSFFVANQARNGVSVIDAGSLKEVAFIATDRGAHGLLMSRDARSLYVANRLAGTISVIDVASHQVTASWRIGGSPDMMTLSPDGARLWTSGRFARAVYVVDTTSGAVVRTIPVGNSPHGLCFFPNPGRLSLGHNGMYR